METVKLRRNKTVNTMEEKKENSAHRTPSGRWKTSLQESRTTYRSILYWQKETSRTLESTESAGILFSFSKDEFEKLLLNYYEILHN